MTGLGMLFALAIVAAGGYLAGRALERRNHER